MSATISGRVLGRYDLWGQLSEGGMSEVYLARHSVLALPVIVKTARSGDGLDHQQLSDSMARAAQLMARVHSSHVVDIIDLGEHPSTHGPTICLVEEYVDGIDLAELDIGRRAGLHRPLPLWCVSEWCARAAAGLHAAHQVGVIHRDIKPANLFLYGEGKIKVGDFGVAVAAADGAEAINAGTLAFMAPEVLAGGTADRRADIFSLGATAFVLRYGIGPYADLTEAAARDCPPRFPAPSSPEEAFFQHVLARMLATNPAARPSTAKTGADVLWRLAQTLHPRFPTRREGRDILAGRCRIRFVEGDLAQTPADAIITSAYSDMSMNAGVGRALARVGGSELVEAAQAAGPQALGSCIVTTPGALPCNAVLHAVSAWSGVSCVGRAIHRALLLAEGRGDRRLALPAVGTGRGGVPLEACAQAIGTALRLHLLLGGTELEQISVVIPDAAALQTFEEVFGAVFLSAHDATASDGHEGLPVTQEDFHASTLFADRLPRRPASS